MPRVCSGTAKGRVLKSPPGRAVRPTSGRVRQAIFSSISDRIAGASVLDLYAGTGAMGIEALSRGAAEAVFAELSPRCLRAIRENLELTGFSDRGVILKGNVLRVLQDLGRKKRRFDLIIADPPYEVKKGAAETQRLADKTLQVLDESGILHPNSLVVVEHSAAGTSPQPPAGLSLVCVRRYGDTAVSIFTSVKNNKQRPAYQAPRGR